MFHGFVCSLQVIVLKHKHCLQYWHIISLFLFLTHLICQRHILDVKTNAWSLVFLFSGHYYYYYYYYYYFTPWEVFIPALDDGLSLKFEWQQVSTNVRHSSPGRSQQCCSLDGLNLPSYFRSSSLFTDP